MFIALGIALDADGEKRDREGRRGIARRKARFIIATDDGQTELLFELSGGGFKKGLIAFELPARELPEIAMAIAPRALADEVASIPGDDGGDDITWRVLGALGVMGGESGHSWRGLGVLGSWGLGVLGTAGRSASDQKR